MSFETHSKRNKSLLPSVPETGKRRTRVTKDTTSDGLTTVTSIYRIWSFIQFEKGLVEELHYLPGYVVLPIVQHP